LDVNIQALWHSGYPQYISTNIGTGIYTPRCSGRAWPDVTMLTLNPTIAPVGRKWGLGSAVSLGDKMMK